ncbi:MAG TPA: HAMP domain-containing sensor histidine kinase [Planctomycetota bacterium]|nr:HAMP domain-containing sensor histidine kinase [Planctomycetota bacterium]
MTRPWHIWAIFGLCLVIVLATMGWTTLTVLRLDEQSTRQTVREENVRLALWRMDYTLTPLLAQETAVPYFAYGAFYPAGRAYSDMFGNVRNGEPVVPSPLLTEGAPHAVLYFQFDPDGQLTSPQVPPKAKMAAAQTYCATPEKVSESAAHLRELKALITRDALMAMLPEEKAPPPASITFLNAGDNKGANDNPATQRSPNDSKNPGNTGNNDLPQNFAQNDVPKQQQAEPRQNKGNYNQKDSIEWANRKRSYDEAQALNNAPPMQIAQNGAYQFNGANILQNSAFTTAPTDASAGVAQGPMKPIWAGPSLLLARRVSVGGKVYVQGCWLDWPWLQEKLLSKVRDLLPDAKLESASDGEGDRSDTVLAALPAKLSPGATIPIEPSASLSPVRISLIIGWGCALLATAAVAALLFGAVSLSERRGAFVSAVTHELRTPLTTFRMYAEMLAGGMVPSDEARQSYLNTLRAESERLTHLVENVLAYARLERGSARSRVERVDLAHLLDAVKPRLAERAAQAGMKLEVDAPSSAAQHVTTDVSAVEQILFNLVDNACKYAASAVHKEIRITAARSGAKASIRVRDAGPGFSDAEARRLFRPFSKSARQAAHTAPGVGLGLALSRRLARDLGGDLRLDRSVKDGACFELTLPAE